MLIISTTICTILGIAACFLIPKVYESDGKLLISQDNMSLMGNGSPLEDIMLSSLGKSDPLTTQMEILKTRPILNRVIDSLGLKEKESVVLQPEDFLERFSFNLVRSTNLIEIKCKSGYADSAALFVNTLMAVYVEKNQQLNQEMISAAKDFIKNQLVEQKIKVEESEQKLVEFKEKTKIMSLDKETEINIAAYSDLNLELIKATGELNAALNQQKIYAKKLDNKSSSNDPRYSMWMASSEQVDNLVAGLNAKKTALEQQLSIQKNMMKDAPVIEAQLISLLREQRISNEIYTSLLSKFEEYKVQEAAKIGSAKIIEPAVTTIKPVLPKKKFVLGLAFLLGISIGLTLVFAVYYFKGTPNSVEEIKNVLENSIAGTIPYQNKMEHCLFVRDCPDTIITEAIRLTQMNLKLKLPVPISNKIKGSVILVTSTQPGEGKSTIAANLAYSYSSSFSTILLNMDFRKPSFKKIFGPSLLDTGIAEGLDGDSAYIPYIQKFDTLDVLNAGATLPNPLDLVQSHAMERFIENLRDRYELIIIDTAPITLVAETLGLLKFADVVSVVVDMSSVHMKNLHVLKSLLPRVNTGIIVNKAFKSNSGYYYQSYK